MAGVAESFLGSAIIDAFLTAHPHVRLEVFVSDEALAIVASGYDAGVRLGEVIEGDMVAVPLTFSADGSVREVAIDEVSETALVRLRFCVQSGCINAGCLTPPDIPASR